MSPAPGIDRSGLADATLVLVRHGQTTWVAEGRFQGSSDPPLSALGERQAGAVAVRLADPLAAPALPVPAGPPRGIWHSPLVRAASTADAIWSAGAQGVPRTAEPGLAELGQGDWEGRTLADVMARWPVELAAWRADPMHHHAPGGEPLSDAAGRASGTVDRILADLGARIGVPANLGMSSRSPVLGYADGAVGVPGDPPESVVEPWAVVIAHDGILRLVLMRLLDVSLDHFWSLPFGLCAISVVEVRAGRARLRAHNLADHLPG